MRQPGGGGQIGRKQVLDGLTHEYYVAALSTPRRHGRTQVTTPNRVSEPYPAELTGHLAEAYDARDDHARYRARHSSQHPAQITAQPATTQTLPQAA